MGIRPGASLDEIQAAYRREAKKWHSDRTGGDDSRMRALNEARRYFEDLDRGAFGPPNGTGGHAEADGAKATPAPYLTPDVIEWRTDDPRRLEPVVIRLKNRGGPVTNISVPQLAGPFWAIEDSNGLSPDQGLADFTFVPAGADSMTAGTHRDAMEIVVDDEAVTLTLRLVVPDRAAFRSPLATDPGSASDHGSSGRGPVPRPSSRSAPSPASSAPVSKYLPGMSDVNRALTATLASLVAFTLCYLLTMALDRQYERAENGSSDALGLAFVKLITALATLAFFLGAIAAFVWLVALIGEPVWKRITDWFDH